MSDSDWDTVTVRAPIRLGWRVSYFPRQVIRKKPASGGVLKTESAVNSARRAGGDVVTEKKCTNPFLKRELWLKKFFLGGGEKKVTAGSNRQTTAAKDSAKLDRETEELHRIVTSLFCHLTRFPMQTTRLALKSLASSSRIAKSSS